MITRGASRTLAWLPLAVGLICGASAANASGLDDGAATGETVLYNSTQGFGDTNSYVAAPVALVAPSAGELTVSVTDEASPQPLTSLQFALTDATSILAPLATTGVETLDLTKPMTVYADVFASSSSGAGLYLLTASFVPSTAVPLPSSIASMAGALLILLIGLSDRWRAAVAAFAQATVITSMA